MFIDYHPEGVVTLLLLDVTSQLPSARKRHIISAYKSFRSDCSIHEFASLGVIGHPQGFKLLHHSAAPLTDEFDSLILSLEFWKNQQTKIDGPAYLNRELMEAVRYLGQQSKFGGIGNPCGPGTRQILLVSDRVSGSGFFWRHNIAHDKAVFERLSVSFSYINASQMEERESFGAQCSLIHDVVQCTTGDMKTPERFWYALTDVEMSEVIEGLLRDQYPRLPDYGVPNDRHSS